MSIQRGVDSLSALKYFVEAPVRMAPSLPKDDSGSNPVNAMLTMALLTS